MQILADGSPASATVSCEGHQLTGILEAASTPGSSSLTYDAGSDAYTYVWKTNKDWAGTCRRFVLTLDDGSPHRRGQLPMTAPAHHAFHTVTSR